VGRGGKPPLIVTLKDVARQAGVSPATASLVLNGKPGIKASTRIKVQEAAKTLGYTPNGMAQRLVTSKSHTIGLIVTDIENPFFASLTRYIDQSIRSYEYGLILSISNDDIETEDRILQDFMRKRVEGVVVVPSFAKRSDFRIYETLEKRGIPFIFATSYYLDFGRRCVMTNLAKGSYLLVKYLLDLGHRSIVFLLSSDLSVALSSFRLQGYRQAFQEKGVPVDESLIVPCVRPDYHCAYQTANSVLKSRKVDAMITINDYMALGAKRAAEELGYRIPEDVSIAGYDDVTFASLSEIPLTTVRQPIGTIGMDSVDQLFASMEGKHAGPEILFVEPELIVRQSTGHVTAARTGA